MNGPTQVFLKENLKFLRQRRKLTQEGLSSDLGMSREKLKAIETGKTVNPGLSDVVHISRYFRVPTDILLTVEVSKLGELKIRAFEAAQQQMIGIVKNDSNDQV
ncbi:helix-turn-helix domain-containing protein [Dyadobacter sp. CY107]|uniref:helix-turn-helix domain-containing protein n=1 Tax=Dyadobacter fanqingshengii TaxID=2906443 RepID=UPI001F31BC7C|nr:helix-turn-helix transcriptional regulator [Dyadobacter fanqingshengii]MCF2506835.1 helix-turn-helix domain-containing protein [Dyadobacter fanqingshengii]